jgi:L-threonylcarbamoyladenylate synthase
MEYLYDSLPSNPRIMEACIRILSADGIAIFPTDTVYGIGCRADREGAVERIYRIKQRSKDLAIPVLISDPGDLSIYGRPGEEALELARENWPGALTLVVFSAGKLARNLSHGESLGFRCPDAPILRDLIRRTGVPLAATSANLSGCAEALSLEGFPEDFRAGVDLILNGGTLPERRPSRVIDCTISPSRILRP